MLPKFKWQLLMLLVGLILIGGGFVLGNSSSGSPKVEIINDESSLNDLGDVVVEVSGQINKPGVYNLSAGSRVEDVINAAGGLTSEADTEFVEKRINRAARLSDGQKIYIPSEEENSKIPNSQNSNNEILGVLDNLININTASQSELESLWGIGPVYAQNIIEQRPYSSVEELLTKKIIKQNVYDRVKDQISVY
ncbi:MAG: hypothetical protein ACD_52C00088G0002 [uncultured bacterium]|uniref:Soluble ligand binding domain-containing protein n=1 Tax=Candidatus Woesebacteria bacterium RIFCSPHIGHO2_12_FULL_41_24 TaxID=1802510 RepID=A0A1F8AST6_9BACT|nr:MAG: hypothetical protein ACD_52C00088G0002 [uncultured bacterium]OGM15004.1 MAG: hypothetical protein A2W15_04195 [Candidatus Woesebacteria bacterium RBG_16_41_13]OGM30003.1 MAG: hypothetical protein A2873_04745 [Candidatus Woesebacteria bacterium RIFCSPHIGHO2_01_FULL_42_80]OGM35081.1 MAG: hypothetical protein A3D84_01910 [Candidatus Woesebacteria bacterium RIFCSPHIGHO2_02_FULL_42_20]OGM54817.1 MAG: hypothetical protein A3E44_01510 [Candidatus Woesebacteria bacterium RIFCSPHIGHO2_12_FULL_41